MGNTLDISGVQKPLRMKQDSDSTRRPVYIGEALPDVLASQLKWRIHKRTYSANGVINISWANGTGDFDKEWDERATYTYASD